MCLHIYLSRACYILLNMASSRFHNSLEMLLNRIDCRTHSLHRDFVPGRDQTDFQVFQTFIGLFAWHLLQNWPQAEVHWIGIRTRWRPEIFLEKCRVVLTEERLGELAGMTGCPVLGEAPIAFPVFFVGPGEQSILKDSVHIILGVDLDSWLDKNQWRLGVPAHGCLDHHRGRFLPPEHGFDLHGQQLDVCW